jgi:hypothetical protein
LRQDEDFIFYSDERFRGEHIGRSTGIDSDQHPSYFIGIGHLVSEDKEANRNMPHITLTKAVIME